MNSDLENEGNLMCGGSVIRGKIRENFQKKYKELDPQSYPEIHGHVAACGKTPAGTHVPVMVNECMHALSLRPGVRGVDCTLGYGGHARAILDRIGESGFLLGMDVDLLESPKTVMRLRDAGYDERRFELFSGNYAGIAKAIASRGWNEVDFIFADLGCSSMQIDDPSRGFTFKDNGPVDMRMNPQRGIGAAEWIARNDAPTLAKILLENADEPQALRIAEGLAGREFTGTKALASEIVRLSGDPSGDTTKRVFQALRIAVNDEFGALDAFMRVAPHCLAKGGVLAVLTFHSGEDRRVKHGIRDGLRNGVFSSTNEDVILAAPEERRANPRSIPAKLRWARKA